MNHGVKCFAALSMSLLAAWIGYTTRDRQMMVASLMAAFCAGAFFREVTA